MPSDWYLMTRPLFNSGFEKEEFNSYAQDGFLELLESFMGTDLTVYEDNDFSKKILCKGVVQNVTTDNENQTSMRQVLLPIGTIKTGFYIKYDEGYWIVMGNVDNNKIYEKAIIVHCNYILRFISDLTKEIVKYPIHMENATQYNSGETYREQATMGLSKYLIFIPYNEETVLLDHGKRFLIDKNTKNPTAYEITQADTVSFNYTKKFSLIRLTVVESQFFSERDNKALMIADYYNHKAGGMPDTTERWL